MRPNSLDPVGMFDGSGKLLPEWYMAIRERLATVDRLNLQGQCDFLADQIGAEDRLAIWATLMWNERPPANVAEQLRRWAGKGMPLWLIQQA